jgi:hypothetical protein
MRLPRAPDAVIAVVGLAAWVVWMQPAPAREGRRVLSGPEVVPCSALSRHPCQPSFCGVFNRNPCFPEFLPPIGQDLRLTVESIDDGDAASDAEKAAKATPDQDRGLDSIAEMYAALRACWIPPPKGQALRGMQYSVRFSFRRDGTIISTPRMTYVSHDAPADVRNVYRDAIKAALDRCTPLHFTPGMGGAVAGRPIAIRFVDNRTIDQRKGQP